MVAGVRGLLAPWIGGASAPAHQRGVRSLLAFWMGGACATPATPQTPPSGQQGGVGGSRGAQHFHRQTQERRRLTEAARERSEIERRAALEAAEAQELPAVGTGPTNPAHLLAPQTESARPVEPSIQYEATQVSAGSKKAPTGRADASAAAVPGARQVVLPDGRTLTGETAQTEEDQMALLMFAMFMAMDD